MLQKEETHSIEAYGGNIGMKTICAICNESMDFDAYTICVECQDFLGDDIARYYRRSYLQTTFGKRNHASLKISVEILE